MCYNRNKKEKRREKMNREKKIISIIMVLLTLILAVGIGTLVHNEQVKKQAQIAYQKQIDTAKSAKNKAYESRKTADIAEAKKEIETLKSSDQKSLLKDLTNLETMLTAINSATQSTTKAHQTLTAENLTQAQKSIDQLQASYEKSDRTKLQAQLDNDKKLLAQKEAEAQKIAQEQQKLAHQKLIALTFDDGPNPDTTPGLLKILADNQVHATFFSLGQEAQSNPAIVKAESDAGNEVASHTWDHKDLVQLSPAAQKQEIQSAHDTITQITGKNVPLFRPPYGNYNTTTLAQTDLSAVNWSIDTNDWRYSTSAPVVANALSAAHPGAIILMHDIHPWSVAAVPQIIQNLKAQGYTFVTVSQLLEAQNGTIQPHQVYFGK
jgi:peptidoglycan/xylan/chitin deacetylase (PgdA/CDA1 family)